MTDSVSMKSCVRARSGAENITNSNASAYPVIPSDASAATRERASTTTSAPPAQMIATMTSKMCTDPVVSGRAIPPLNSSVAPSQPL